MFQFISHSRQQMRQTEGLLEGAKKLLEQEVICGSDLKAIMDKY